MSVVISDADHLSIMLLLKKLAKVEESLENVDFDYAPDTAVLGINTVMLYRGDFQLAKELLCAVASAPVQPRANLMDLKLK